MKTLAFAPLTTPEDNARRGFVDLEFCSDEATSWEGTNAPDTGMIRLRDDGSFELLKFNPGNVLPVFALTKDDYDNLQAIVGETC